MVCLQINTFNTHYQNLVTSGVIFYDKKYN